ncbi:MAG TPA: META domain-containing protein, partial [Chryseolinea sp.]|nr:META domain-containing protein [Chryseolinea sp.]
VLTPADSKEIHIILTTVDSEQRLKGFAGCNAIGGNFRTNGNEIHFTVISTKMFCHNRMEIENYLTSALSKAQTYSIEGEALSLYQGKEKLITLQAVYFK